MAFLYYDYKVYSATGYERVLRISQLLWKLRFLIKSPVQELTHTNTIEDGPSIKTIIVFMFYSKTFNRSISRYYLCRYKFYSIRTAISNTLHEKSAILWIKHESLRELPLQLWGGGEEGATDKLVLF